MISTYHNGTEDSNCHEQSPTMRRKKAKDRSPQDPDTLMSLSPELHLLITSHLLYPDALALKHTNRYFYIIVQTGVGLKIGWLMERRRLHLECPNEGPCRLNTDEHFCRGSVRLLMQRRRQHGECEDRKGGRGCLVMGTSRCEVIAKKRRVWRGVALQAVLISVSVALALWSRATALAARLVSAPHDFLIPAAGTNTNTSLFTDGL